MLRDEINEQPSVVAGILDHELQNIVRVADALSEADVSYIVIAARGTSDNAARYGKYLFGSRLGLQVALATPSLFTLYGRPPRLDQALVIGVSQSGESEDVISVLREARHQGAPTVAITNSPQSPLASEAQHLIETRAGQEQSIAATKTYTSQLAVMAALVACWTGDQASLEDLKRAPAHMAQALQLEPQIQIYAQRYRTAQHFVVLGRGYNYATAFEIALKLKETCYLAAEPYSPADFLHGPIALVESGYPALVVAPSGAAYENLVEFAQALRARGASILMISDHAQALELAEAPLEAMHDMAEWLTPLAAVIPGQFLAFHLAHARGIDPDKPRGLTKVTITR